MRILWITNIMMPPICEAMGLPSPATGGWMYSSLKRLMDNSTHKFAVATIYESNEFICREVDNITYYLLPLRGKSPFAYNCHLEKFWVHIKSSFCPDIVHIHGSELPHGLAYVKSCGNIGAVVSIQGIISVYARYFTAGIEFRDIKKSLTLRDVLKHNSILQGQQSFINRGKAEIELLASVNNIIGRTEWDKTHALTINQNAQYHYCGETLRDPFYKHKWAYDKCEPHSIFVSQASYPIKGLHMLIKALPLILRHYPDTRVYVAGPDPTNGPLWRISGYGKFLRKLIKRLGIRPYIIFTGLLDEETMCQRYLKSNVFVCCSAIENSPNSLGEAQLLGMPYVASLVGGIPEIVNWDSNVLYRFEEYEMLAQKIVTIFESNNNFQIETDLSRYDGERNCSELLKIYNRLSD